jgi:hypothetical protein
MRVKKHFAQRAIQDNILRQICNISAALILAITMVFLTSADATACASCGCTLSSDWENMQFSFTPGLKLDLRYDYINQNQLWSGSKSISPTAASQVIVNGHPNEVEKYTINNYLTLGIDYSMSHDWGVNIQVPYIDRKHSTLGMGSDGYTPVPGGGQYDSHTKSIGDVKVIGRYQGFTPQCNFGVLYGVKLPTGSYNESGTSTDPTAPGPVPIDPGLQPGTGSTDAILGAFYTNNLGMQWGYFAQALVQRAVLHRGDYRPGDAISANLGLRYLGISSFFPQLQLNFRGAHRDSEAIADVGNTGGTLLYVSPGVDVPVSTHVSLYAFLQVPVYQNLNGVQLAPRYTTSVGVHYSF